VHDHGHPRRLDLVDDEVGLGSRVEYDAELEFVGESESRGDVGGPVGRDEERPVAGEHLSERFEPEVGVGAFRFVGELPFAGVLAGFYELGPQHRHRLAAGAGRFLVGAVAGGPGRVAERGGYHRHRAEHGRIGRRAGELHRHGLACHERPRGMARVDRGDTEATEPLDEPLLRVVGVDGPQFRLDRLDGVELVLVLRLIEIAGQADHAVRIHEARGDDGPAQFPRILRDRRRGGGADGANFPPVDHDHAVRDWCAGHGVHDVAVHHERLAAAAQTLPRDARADDSRSETAVTRDTMPGAHRIAPTVVGPLQHDSARWSRLAPNPPTANSRSSGSSRSNTFRPST
jgi:hypothetical protein